MDFLDRLFNEVDSRELFYVIAPVYDFALIYIIYKVSYWIIESQIKSKSEKPSFGLKIWRFIFYGAIGFILCYVITQFAPTKRHLFINHYIKLCLMFVLPILYAVSVLMRSTKIENPKVLEFLEKLNRPHLMKRGKEKVFFSIIGGIYAFVMVIVGGGFAILLLGVFLVMLKRFLT